MGNLLKKYRASKENVELEFERHRPLIDMMQNKEDLTPIRHRRSMITQRKLSRHVYSHTTSVLEPNKRRIIKSTWQVVKKWCGQNDTSPGKCVFEKIFVAIPELRAVFRLGKNESLGDLDHDHPFMVHTRVFSNIMDLMVRNVDELEVQMAPALITYGRRHFYKHRVGFTPAYISVFASSMLEFVCETLSESNTPCDDVAGPWKQLIQYILDKMKEGYDIESMYRGRRYTTLF